MREQIEKRLSELRTEFEVGQKVMAELDIRQANLRSTLLRIGGAMQVLEEMLGEKGTGDALPQKYESHLDRVSTGSGSDLVQP